MFNLSDFDTSSDSDSSSYSSDFEDEKNDSEMMLENFRETRPEQYNFGLKVRKLLVDNKYIVI